MKNNFTQLIKSGIYSLLVFAMLGFVASSALAQASMTPTFPDAGTKIAGESGEVSYIASGFDAGTTFFLYYDTFSEATTLASSTVQGATETLSFTWPMASTADLYIGAYTGDIFTPYSFPAVTDADFILKGGTDETNFGYSMDRAGSRFVLSKAFDVNATDVPEKVTLKVTLNDDGDLEADMNPVKVQYSIDAGSTFTDLTIDVTTVAGDTPALDQALIYGFDTNDQFWFDLPPAAKTAATHFRVIQMDAGTLAADSRTWDINSFAIDVGETYASTGSIAMTSTFTISNPTLAVTATVVGDTPTTDFYGGDDITVEGSFNITDLDMYKYAVVLTEDGGMGSKHMLNMPVTTVNSASNSLSISGSIPVEIDDLNDYTVKIYPYDKTADALIIGDMTSVDFTNTTAVDDYEEEGAVILGGDNNGDGLLMDEVGERSVLSSVFEVVSEGKLTVELARASDVPSLSGTDLTLEYTTDGGATFTAIKTITLNELAFVGDGTTTFDFEEDTWPTGMVGPSVWLRVSQEGNNGAGLDDWYLVYTSVSSTSNFEDLASFNTGMTINIERVEVDIDPLDITPTSLAYPLTEFTATYTITEGEFPAGTGAQLLLTRNEDDESDLILSEVADITTAGSFDFMVPPIEAGDYVLYIRVDTDYLTDNMFGSVTLPVYNVSLDVTEVTFSNSVSLGGDAYAIPGADVTVTYEITGDLGDAAEIILSLWNPDLAGGAGYEMLTAAAAGTSITGTLPTGFNYGATPKLKISIGSGVYNDGFNVNYYFYQDFNVLDKDFWNSYNGLVATDLSGWNDAFGDNGERWATSKEIDVSQGGEISATVYSDWDASNFESAFTVKLQGSTDGDTWEDIEEFDFTTNGQNVSKVIDVPSNLYSDTFQLRFVQEGDNVYGENVWHIYTLSIDVPEFLETAVTDIPFNILLPTLDVESIDTDYIIGESITANFNALNFPETTEYAFVLEQGTEYYVIGKTSDQGASTISGVLPFGPIDMVSPNAAYNVGIVPYTPLVAGGDVLQGISESLEEEGVLLIEGDDNVAGNGYDDFTFDQSGARFILTDAVDFTDAASANVTFDIDFSGGFNPDLFTNKHVVPRLEVSIDAGVTFVAIPLMELEDGQEQIYDDGLIYMDQGYDVMVPEAYLTEATHFRWSQPLNLGSGENEWRVKDITLIIDSGNDMPSNLFAETNNPQGITIDSPNLDHYVWGQTDLDDPVFNGNSFSYTFETDENVEIPDMFPEGTWFVFSLDGETDPDTNEDVIIGTSAALGEETGSVPFFITNGNYDVNVSAYIMIDDVPFPIYEDEDIGDLDIFLNVVDLTYVGEDDLATLYAGSSVEFSIDVQNVESASDSFDDLYANLIVDYLGEDWLLATQQGIDNITIDLPPFMRSGLGTNPIFSVRLTEDAPLGEAGTILDPNDNLADLENDASNFIAGQVSPGNYVYLEGTGRKVATTRDIEASELENASLLSFEVNFTQLPEDLTEDQYVIFEVSTDGGATYSPWETFPEVDAEDPLNYDYFVYEVTDAMKAGTTRLRWRQEEYQGTNFFVRNISFSFGEVLPFEYVSTTIDDIQDQAVIITSIDSEEACIDGDISINYEIRGVYGDENKLKVYYSGPSSNWIYDVDMGVGQGTGTAVFNMPSEILAQGAGSADFEFNLVVDDNSFNELLSEIPGVGDSNYNEDDDWSSISEQSVNVVAPIDLEQEFSIGNTQILCAPEDIIITVNDPNDNFTYEIFSVADGTVLGSLTYDADLDDDEINIGMMTGTVELGMHIMSATKSGAVCNVLTTTYTDITTSVDIYSLYRSRNAGNYVPTVGESEIVCSAATNLQLRLLRPSNSNSGGLSTLTSSAAIEWFRDDLATPVSANGGWNKSDFASTGNYFARVTNEGCEYITESIRIEVIAAIDEVPEVTVVSGDLISCDADINVELAAPAGFSYYLWNSGESTENISVTDAGSYNVQVSNVPFDLACESPSSLTVEVESAGGVDFQASLTDDNDNDALGTANEVEEGDEFEGCDSIEVFFFEDGGYQNDNSVIIFKDGVEYASTVSDSYVFQESGTYSMTWSSDDLTYTCDQTIGDFTVIINKTPIGKPTLTSAGALSACDDDLDVTLTAPAGFSHYKWSYDADGSGTGTAVSDVSTSNTFEGIHPGEYKVAVGNSEDCTGDWSRIITLTAVSADNAPALTLITNTECGASATSIKVSSSQSDNSYQIYNSMTDLAEGDPVVGNGGVITLTSSAHDEVADFYVMATLTDGSGCTGEPSADVTGKVNNVLLRASGNVISVQIESVNSSTGAYEIIWHRNGAKMLNVNGDAGEINVIDDATYSVEVIFGDSTDGACSVTSNAVTLGGGAGGNVIVPEFASSIYPNPTRDEFNLKVDGEDFGIYSVQILTLSGKVVFTDSFDKQTVDFTVPISMSNLKAGIYTVIINNDNINSTLRAIKL
jgi:hypothetical protein